MTALPPDASPPDAAPPATSSSEPARRQVLVVDDDARLRDLLQRYLSQNGFEVTVAADAHAMNRLLPAGSGT